MDEKTAVLNRLKRLDGQIGGLINLIEKGEDCEQVFIQFKAAKSALDGAFATLLKLNLAECAQKKDRRKMDHIIDLLTKM